MTVRVLIAEDSTTTRTALAQVLDADPGITVVGLAANGIEAVSLTLELRPSLVVMDIDMPGMDGFEATKRIMRECPTPIVIITSSSDPKDVAISFEATRAGALAVSPKPSLAAGPDSDLHPNRLLRTVKALADVAVVARRWHETERPRRAPTGRLRCIGVAASTGGPPALARFLSCLPPDFEPPVLVVQHIAAGFVGGLAKFLGASTPLPVRLASEKEEILPGTVYLAPDGEHMRVAGGPVFEFADEPDSSAFRPSADVLFSSLAMVYGERAAVVVLTGMGSDGLAGARDVHDAGGMVLAQDRASAVVFGMPAAVAGAGIADEVGAVEVLARRVVESSIRRGGGVR